MHQYRSTQEPRLYSSTKLKQQIPQPLNSLCSLAVNLYRLILCKKNSFRSLRFRLRNNFADNYCLRKYCLRRPHKSFVIKDKLKQTSSPLCTYILSQNLNLEAQSVRTKVGCQKGMQKL